MTQLTGKVALVTGGSRGIGAAVAKRLAHDGAEVALTYAGSEDKAQAVVADIEQAGGRAMAIQADSRDDRAIEAAVERVVSSYGGLDILVNNAGVFLIGDIAELERDDLDRTLAINLRAPFVAIQVAARHMRDEGRIVSIGSNLGPRVPWPGLSLYAMSKTGLIGLTKGAARDLGARGITVNVVHPGSTDTDMNPADGELSDLQRGAMAIPRYNEADDVANLVRWLAGPEGRSVTGAEFTIDGGANA
ncbi:SDR family NAD(P)-dependent oxidoreductase [Halomonas caseinilytica]|uniref:NAD(P)-dependent dehydrogenase, short-chain alcohol dehydrogenase family n=1 Tax=Halomonas caseinilytica TaxID=438744 RepID=A0A1M6NGI1_9GAMM|nr:3-oxoacyl-ACP reductase family protein [Halomonas caseinilytica]SEM46278.1 NAD(P)-dependent dehydrogenase, short-chain alcohol dehydrogenase family [Halomonas caseinilytica]SHJ94713.1 NAD(P)-dependent dehydrogenase, short-chain alcohol dehydrogenase family [Halomonas caseinilytica]